MELDKGSTNKKAKMFSYAGAYIMSVMGAGYASGQEFLQYFTGFGYAGIIGTVLVTVFFAVYGVVFMDIGHQIKASSHGDVLRFICGKRIGTIFEWILTFFLFGVVAIMLSGSGATISQYFSINPYIGTIIMAIVTIITNLYGLEAIIKAISPFAPVTVIIMLLVSIITVIINPSGILEAGQALETITVSNVTSSWLISAVIYALYCILPIVPIITAIGAEEEDRNLILKSGALGGIIIGICVIVANFSMVSMVESIVDKQIPMLYLAEEISSIFGFSFTFILLGAIYTTAASVLYGFCTQFAKQGSVKYRRITIISGVAATIAGFFPFSILVGIITPIIGYMGLVVMLGIIKHYANL